MGWLTPSTAGIQSSSPDPLTVSSVKKPLLDRNSVGLVRPGRLHVIVSRCTPEIPEASTRVPTFHMDECVQAPFQFLISHHSESIRCGFSLLSGHDPSALE